MRGPRPGPEGDSDGAHEPNLPRCTAGHRRALGEFRRALRRRDQPRFDRVFEYAREHADASGLLNHQNPLLPALLSIDLEQEGRLDDHEERLEELEAAVAARDDQESSPPDANP